jgi:hypothetical protein
MHLTINRFAVALSLAFVSPLVISAIDGRAIAQEQAAPAEAPLKQIPLTAQQIEGFLAAQKPIAAIVNKLSDTESENPSPQVIAQLDAVAKANKFASYAEFNDVADNISMVVGGIDPQTKKYVGADVIIKQQIADIQGDKTMSAKDKKEQIDDLNDQLKAVEPVKIQGNIDLVLKYYDQIIAAMPQDSQ